MGAHTYDTGLALAQRTLIRNAVIAKLAPLLRANGRYVLAIKPIPRRYRGEGDIEGRQQLVNALLGQTPAIGVALGRKTYEATDGDAFISLGELELSIVVISQHGRDPALVEGRLATDPVGDAAITADPGIEAMLEHVEELLLGQSIGVAGTSELRPVDEEEVETAENGSIWQQTYSIRVERQINPSRGNTLITSIEAKTTPEGIADSDPNSAADLNPLIDTITTLEEP